MFRIILAAIISIYLCGMGLAEEKVLNRLSLDTLGDFDQLRALRDGEFEIALEYREGLVRFAKGDQFAPGLASSWSHSEDYKSWEFTLREDVLWSDGHKFEAQQVLDGIELRLRMAKDQIDTKAGALMGIVNAFEFEADPSIGFDKVGAKLVAPNVVRFDFENSEFYFLEKVADQGFFVLPTHVDLPIDPRDHKALVVIGAYMPSDFEEGKFIKFERNPNYYDNETVYFDYVNSYAFNLETISVFGAVRELDIHLVRDVHSDVAGWYLENKPEEFLIQSKPEIGYLDVNFNHPDFAKKDIRCALEMAIDRNVIANDLLQDQTAIASRWFPTSIPDLAPFERTEMGTEMGTETGLEIRQQAARDILEKHGYSVDNPLEFELSAMEDTNNNIPTALKSMWSKVGFEAHIIERGIKAHYVDFLVPHKFDVAYAAWSGVTHDPMYYIYFAHSNSEVSDIYNYGQSKSEAFDREIDLANASLNIRDRKSHIFKAEQLLLNDCMKIPLRYYNEGMVLSTKIDGYVENFLGLTLSRWLSFKEMNSGKL